MRRHRWHRRRRLLLVAVAALSAALGIATHAIGIFHRTELQTLDARFQLRGTKSALLKDFVVVGVDSSTLSYFQTGTAVRDGYAANWPFPRRDHARVIDNLVNRRRRPDRGRHPVSRSRPTRPTTTRWQLLLQRPATSCSPPPRSGRTAPPTSSVATPTSGPSALAGRQRDRDPRQRRRLPAHAGLLPGAGDLRTAIAAEISGKPVQPKLFGGATTPVPIDYAGPPGTVTFIPYWKVYSGQFDRALVKGKTVLIGATAAVLQDVHQTPMSGTGSSSSLMSGTEIVANEAATVLHGIPLRGDAGWVNVLLIIVLGAAAPLLGQRGWALRALAGGALIGAIYAIVAQLLFDSGSIIAIIDPEFALVLGIVGTLGVVYLGEAFERQYARATFSRFVPPGVVDEVLASTDDDLRLAAVERVCTVMFSDLRGFTRFSEHQPVEKVIAVVNHYLNEMTEAILDAGGTLIAYMGDGIMATFGARWSRTITPTGRCARRGR